MMKNDEHAIRALLARWHEASAAGDVEAVLALMSDDVMFLVAGKPPMRGRETFAKGLRTLLTQHRIESTGEVQEVEISGTLAYTRTELNVKIIPLRGGNATIRAGSAMSILRKQSDGNWLLIRDANLLPAG